MGLRIIKEKNHVVRMTMKQDWMEILWQKGDITIR